MRRERERDDAGDERRGVTEKEAVKMLVRNDEAGKRKIRAEARGKRNMRERESEEEP